MDDPAIASSGNDAGDDVAMDVEQDVQIVESTAEDPLPGPIDEESRHVRFIDYLKSPMVQIRVGSGESMTVLSAHQDLLTKSPWFEQRCAEFAETGSRIIDLPEEDVDAVGMVLEYIYNEDYFPKMVGSGRDQKVEDDPDFPLPDDTGALLLRHARVYTLGEKFMLPKLKKLAHNKIHRTTSTGRGELTYARYVYANVPADDVTARKPVAAFWATRSHVLRHSAEEEFRAMCLEYPQFAYDVLSQVLDQKEKGKGGAAEASVTVDTPSSKAGRKRPRVSGI